MKSIALPHPFCFAALFACTAAVAQTRPAVVEVVASTPLPGIGQAKNEIAAPVQTATDADVARLNALDLGDFLARSAAGVHLNETQGNPFQVDLNYRGFTASPLLGTPQGLSVYLDGVRLNQPFGDVVSWDLIPRAAIAATTLIPGSNPLFGLNTLGGALAITSKDGRSHPGAAIQVGYGSHARRNIEGEFGGSDHARDWYVTANVFREHGWRDDSPSRLGQFFGKLGWRGETGEAKLTYAYADNMLTGNGMQQKSLLDAAYASVYSKPDITENRSHFLNLSASRALGDALLFAGNAWYRNIRTATLNGDVNDDTLDQALYQPDAAERAALAAAGYTGFPLAGETAANTPFPFWRCIANVLLNDEPAEKCNGMINRTRTDQHNFGFSAQLTHAGRLGRHRNQLTAGIAYDASRVRFRQSAQLGYLNPDRGITALPAFGDGVSGGSVDGEPWDARVELASRTQTASVYATDTVSFDERWHLTVSGRYDRTRVRNRDAINPPGSAASLDGDHLFSRFNPALGATFTPSRSFAAFLGASQGSRAPSAIELGCANPEQPCRLPNSMAGDPPLAQVVTRTVDAGMHGELAGGGRWTASVFRAENRDDILFVAAPNAAQFGYFKNFGKTRRQGIELGFAARASDFDWGANYTFLDATFRSAEVLNGAGNSSNSAAQAGSKGLEGTIEVQPGKRIPLVPRHLLKLFAEYRATPALSIGGNVVGVGASYARGNENNAHQADGTHYLGPGRSSGYMLLNLSARYRLEPRITLIGQIGNVFDRKYATAAWLGASAFDANGNFSARPFAPVGADYPLRYATFFAPGAPRSFWFGVRYTFDAPPATR